MIITPHISISPYQNTLLLEMSGAEIYSHLKISFDHILHTLNNNLLSLTNQFEENNNQNTAIVEYEQQLRTFNKLNPFIKLFTKHPTIPSIPKIDDNPQIIKIKKDITDIKDIIDQLNSYKNPKLFYLAIIIQGNIQDNTFYQSLCTMK